MLKVLKSLQQLVVAWHQTDRVRISPSTGRLLGLKPGDRFVFRGESFAVTTRVVQQNETSHELFFEVASSLGDGKLSVVRDRVTEQITGALEVPTLNLSIFDSDIIPLRGSEFS